MLSGLDAATVALLLAAGVVVDLLLGEPRRWHPLVGFGRMAAAVERLLNLHGPQRPWQAAWGSRAGGDPQATVKTTAASGNYLRGLLAWTLAVLPVVALAAYAAHILPTPAALTLHLVLLYACLGLRSLRDHVLPIGAALAAGDLQQARHLTERIVSRDTAQADESDLAKAAAESTLENGNDAVFGTLFWFAIAGGAGALLFRLANTLDAMWGYRNARFLAFGCASARIDDGLNWVPARLTALSYALAGNTANALRCWRTQAPAWSSPNAGPVMAAGAGALCIALGGAAVYEGVRENRPPLGAGRLPAAADIARVWQLVARSVVLWLGVAGGAALVSIIWRN